MPPPSPCTWAGRPRRVGPPAVGQGPRAGREAAGALVRPQRRVRRARPLPPLLRVSPAATRTRGPPAGARRRWSAASRVDGQPWRYVVPQSVRRPDLQSQLDHVVLRSVGGRSSPKCPLRASRSPGDTAKVRSKDPFPFVDDPVNRPGSLRTDELRAPGRLPTPAVTAAAPICPREINSSGIQRMDLAVGAGGRCRGPVHSRGDRCPDIRRDRSPGGRPNVRGLLHPDRRRST